MMTIEGKGMNQYHHQAKRRKFQRGSLPRGKDQEEISSHHKYVDILKKDKKHSGNKGKKKKKIEVSRSRNKVQHRHLKNYGGCYKKLCFTL